VAWTYDITPAPAVGGKLTAAGFGAEVDGAIAELQAVLDTTTGGTAAAGATAWATIRDQLSYNLWTEPGAEDPSHTLSGPPRSPRAPGSPPSSRPQLAAPPGS
jgi:hypothetical protein